MSLVHKRNTLFHDLCDTQKKIENITPCEREKRIKIQNKLRKYHFDRAQSQFLIIFLFSFLAIVFRSMCPLSLIFCVSLLITMTNPFRFVGQVNILWVIKSVRASFFYWFTFFKYKKQPARKRKKRSTICNGMPIIPEFWWKINSIYIITKYDNIN